MNPPTSVLLTDFYQLTMLQAYLAEGMQETAVFEFFVRGLPTRRNFLLAAGLDQVLDYLETLRFDEQDLAFLEAHGGFTPRFLDALRTLRFTGEVHALPEGTVCFPHEPLVRVTAPIAQAQLVESRIINLLHFQTLVASKAARCVLAAPGKLLVDFGLRRAHGAEAGLLAARAAYLAGFTGTATVLAGARFGIPLYGTMAHSYIEAHDVEADAFDAFARCHPGNVVLLLDTYDTEAAARKVVALAPALARRGIHIASVRLDSGDLAAHARSVRAILDAGGLAQVRVFASGNLDEVRIAALLADGAPVDGFGIGTHLTTSGDAPFLDCAYKLEEYAGRARRKRSEGKPTWPGRKQVYRRHDGDGRMCGDTVALEGDPPDGTALLVPVMRAGKRLIPADNLASARARAGAELARLPAPLRALDPAEPYPVRIAPSLHALAREVDRRTG